MGMKHTCPRRIGELGPWVHGNNLDMWETHRFGEMWRECSFCGGLHPEDAIKLLKFPGTEIVTTDKNYKIYLRGIGLREQAKVYFMHFNEEQRKEWNEEVKFFHCDEDLTMRREWNVKGTNPSKRCGK